MKNNNDNSFQIKSRGSGKTTQFNNMKKDELYYELKVCLGLLNDDDYSSQLLKRFINNFINLNYESEDYKNENK